MTVKVLPGLGIYHHRVREDGTTDEHVTQTPIRRTPSAYIVYCAPCDAVSVWRRDVPSEDLRQIERAIAGRKQDGTPKPPHQVIDIADVLDPLSKRLRFDYDPLDLAREDGDTRIPAVLPTGHNERRALARSLSSQVLSNDGLMFNERIGGIQ